ncbi:DUF1002 domain-containing protein [Halobacillus sp. ACCC02827]|uniref:DUF1002 domain-containing protein n=1 Tax=Halobacillus sp. ACCC02827 TaxID=3052090 RepID=UPI00256FC4E6|nr:DUF1002 domain-containing protein [Halobacillus sp. ACCC02827]WJE16087.1 DUF1002 domain-containing protein [Halobacillus sp. ACCC02827]
MIKRIGIWFTIVTLLTLAVLPMTSYASTGDQGINEKLGLPIVVYGEALSPEQKAEVKELLEVDQHDQVDEFTVNGQDLNEYIGGNPNANMYSSVKIIHKEDSGLHLEIVTPDNITQVTKEMYTNALLTAGVENADVLVASSVKVSGHSALTGIYKAYDAKGVKLDKERMQVASEELDVATSIAKESGVDEAKISELLTEIKKEIAEQDPATKEEVEQIVEEKLNSLNIELSPEDRQRLTDLFEKMRDLNINFDAVKNQLDDLTGNIKDLVQDEGFWASLKNAILSFLEAIVNFFRNLFS